MEGVVEYVEEGNCEKTKMRWKGLKEKVKSIELPKFLKDRIHWRTKDTGATMGGLQQQQHQQLQAQLHNAHELSIRIEERKDDSHLHLQHLQSEPSPSAVTGMDFNPTLANLPPQESSTTNRGIVVIDPLPSFNIEKRLNHLFVILLILLFSSAYFVSLLGIDSIIGSLLFGIIIPRQSKIYSYLFQHLHYFVVYFFLPIYFTLSGLKTNFTSLYFIPDFWLLILVCFIATLGKVLGGGIAAYYFTYSKSESAVIAILMNTRGLIELIVLNIGFTAGILNERIFSMFVIMCLFTTMISYPLVSWIYSKELAVAKRAQQLRRLSSRNLHNPNDDGDDDEGHEDNNDRGNRLSDQLVADLQQSEVALMELTNIHHVLISDEFKDYDDIESEGYSYRFPTPPSESQYVREKEIEKDGSLKLPTSPNYSTDNERNTGKFVPLKQQQAENFSEIEI